MAGHPRVLFSWIGQNDLNASKAGNDRGDGPLAETLAARTFDEVVLLSNYPKKDTEAYLRWLRKRCAVKPSIDYVKLSTPMHYGEIYDAVVDIMATTRERVGKGAPLYCLLSPGTSAMASIWIIVAKTRFGATLLQASREGGIEEVLIPFDLSADYLPDLYSGPDQALARMSRGELAHTPGFEDIHYKSAAMGRVVGRAQQAAIRSVPVLIEGESGTGKELFARAIHRSSTRAGGPFIPVNCGAISPDLVEAEFFGHTREAFTGATKARDGHFRAANEGTLFLDEVGELPLAMQVKLLRVLQEGKVTPVGASGEVSVDVRIVAATNRSLVHEVRAGNFRQDLFYRLAVAVLRLPPLRERQGDLSLLIDRLLERINTDGASEPAWKRKKISAAARNVLTGHHWPGNVRELQNTLTRACVWTQGATIDKAAAEEALMKVALDPGAGDGVLNRPLDDGLDLKELLGEVAHHYLERAWEAAHHRKQRAADMVGLNTYQTFKDWAHKYGVDLED